MKRSFTLLLTIMLMLPFASMAQSTLKGKITDADSGETLIGATILVTSTEKGTVTDLDGNFSLENVTLPAILQITYTGYEIHEQTVETDAYLEITLDPSSETLDEIVVLGYGQTKKRVATGAISKLTSEDMEGIVASDVSATLEGQVTGLIVNESSGQPGSSKAILIRGISTNGDNSPLFIVDGLQVGNIDNINTGDVESIDVLKDAASCAIYGARAANGVVIITTKKGVNDKGGQITYEASLVNSRPWKIPEMLNSDDYIAITREKFANSNQTAALEQLGFPALGSAQENNTRWMEEIFAPANVINHRISANVKNAFMSLDYWDQNGVIGGDKSNYKRYSARVNSTKEINDYIKVGENIYVNRVENRNIGVNNSFGTVIVDAFAYDPLTGIYNDDKQYGFEQSDWVKKEYVNPFSRLFLDNGRGHGDQIQGNVFIEIKPIKHLRIRSDAGIENTWYDYSSFTPEYRYHDAFVNINNSVVQGYGTSQGLQLENYANYNRSFGEETHNFDVVVGQTYRANKFRQSGGSTQSIPEAVQFDPNWQYLDAGQDSSDLAFGNAAIDYHLISYFGRVQYDYENKYLFTATLRRDGSSNFGSNNRWGMFPSASVGWVLTKEKFFNFEPVSYLKVRASWGVNGNDRIRPLSFASRIENVFTYSFGQDPILNTGAALATPPNPNVKWEESDQIDIGVELELMDGVWNVEADIYRKTTKDLLMSETIPGFIGATNNPISNLGEIRNQGFELGIGHRYRTKDLTLRTNLTYTAFENEVINVAGDAGFLNGWGWPVRNTPITRMTEGFPVGHFVGYQSDGIFQSQEEIFGHLNSNGDLLQPDAVPGDLKFLDTNGDGTITLMISDTSVRRGRITSSV